MKDVMCRASNILKVLVFSIALFVPLASVADCCCKKIVEYEIASAYLKDSFIAEVEKLIKKGFQPFEGVYIDKESSWMYQAMVKYEEDSK